MMHVPPENLARYRRLMALSRHLESIGNHRSGRGDYDGANAVWLRATLARARGYELRVPGRDK